MQLFFRENKVRITFVTIIIIISSIGTYTTTPKKAFKLKPPEINALDKYEVVSVLDGDTFEVKIGKSFWKVRMIGIDTPETVDPKKPVQCFGKEASENTKKLLYGKFVKLDLDETQDVLDKFNRLLAYVYVDDIFLNKYLIENGFAREYTYSKKYEMQKEFRKVEKEARGDSRGLWLSCFQK